MNNDFLKRLRIRTANLAVGPSTVRNQGASGVVSSARQALIAVDLQKFKTVAKSKFRHLLDDETDNICKKLPKGARNWGAARKCLNIYLRDVLYSRYLCNTYKLDRLETYLEVPLDKDIATRLLAETEGSALPRWKTIKGLQAEISDQFQNVAGEVAQRTKLHRVHLDLLFWRRSQE